MVPFLVQDLLVENGGVYRKDADWQAYVVTDRAFITGQNPASSEPAARALLARQTTCSAIRTARNPPNKKPPWPTAAQTPSPTP